MLRETSFRLVPDSSGSFSRLEASFKIRCPFFIFGRKCLGYVEAKGLRIGERSDGHTIAEQRTRVRFRCLRCRGRISIIQAEWDQLLGEARRFLASERR